MADRTPGRDISLGPIFTTAQAARAGISRRQLAGRDYRRLIRGSYWRTDTPPTLPQQVRHLLRTLDAAEFASHHTAAGLWHAVTPTASDIHLGTRRRRHTLQSGVRFHFYTHRPEVVSVRGLWITTPRQTFLDLAAFLEFVDLLVLGDSLVRRTRTTPRQLVAFVADRHTNGASRAREAAALVRPNVDSPNESRLRLLIVSAGLPAVSVNYVVRIGERKRRLDLALSELKLAIEFDGRHHVDLRTQWDEDLLRREELEALGWRFIVITSTSMYAEPIKVLQRIADAIALVTGQRPRIGDGWRRHFG